MLNLNKEDIDYLRENGENDIAICQIIRAFDYTKFELWQYNEDDENCNGEPIITKIPKKDILKYIDKENLISGMERSAFHCSSVRESYINNKAFISFDTYAFFDKKEKIEDIDAYNKKLFKKLFNRDYNPALWDKYWKEKVTNQENKKEKNKKER